MADSQKRMNINWILANDYVPDPTIDLDQLKTCGAFWGGWQTWRACGTDNVICHDMGKASDLIKRAFHAVCNFYIPNSIYASLDRPAGVRLYEGNFVHDLDNHEEIVAMHLVASASDIVLMLGYNFIEPAKNQDRLVEHRAHNYRSLCKQAIVMNPQVQWILVDHPGEVMKDWKGIDNLVCDTLSNCLDVVNQLSI
jgi:hypothetical protein